MDGSRAWRRKEAAGARPAGRLPREIKHSRVQPHRLQENADKQRQMEDRGEKERMVKIRAKQ